VIAINFREDDDELIGAELVTADDDLLLVSRKGQSVRFRADDSQLRPMGRATSGVTGMKFRSGDQLLSMSVVPHSPDEDSPTRYVFTATDGGWAKRTVVEDYRVQGRGGLGIKAMKLQDSRGSLVGAMVVTDTDEVMAIKASGQVTRSAAADVPAKGRDTMGVKFVTVAEDDSVVGIARNTEREVDEEILDGTEAVDPELPDDITDGGEGTAETTTSVVDETSDVVPDSSAETHDTAAQEDGPE
jgi:DNA gyrase subunit A